MLPCHISTILNKCAMDLHHHGEDDLALILQVMSACFANGSTHLLQMVPVMKLAKDFVKEIEEKRE